MPIARQWIYVAVHRGHGVWTHVYDVVHLPGAFGEEIRLIRVLPGDRRDEARSWALAGKETNYCARHRQCAVHTTQESKCLLPAAP